MEKEEIKIKEVVGGAPTEEAREPQRNFKKNARKSTPRREPRAKPEFDQKIISVRRVTRVVTGG